MTDQPSPIMAAIRLVEAWTERREAVEAGLLSEAVEASIHPEQDPDRRASQAVLQSVLRAILAQLESAIAAGAIPAERVQALGAALARGVPASSLALAPREEAFTVVQRVVARAARGNPAPAGADRAIWALDAAIRGSAPEAWRALRESAAGTRRRERAPAMVLRSVFRGKFGRNR